MALTIKFYVGAQINTQMTANSITINKDGSCIVTADEPVSFAAEDASQIHRFPAINYKIEIVKDAAT